MADRGPVHSNEDHLVNALASGARSESSQPTSERDITNLEISSFADSGQAPAERTDTRAWRRTITVSRKTIGDADAEAFRREWLEAELSASDRQRLAQGLHLAVPAHFEVHPYHSSQRVACSNNCQHCTKRDDRRDLRRLGIEGINREPLLKLISSLATRGVPELVISGNSTEPLLYPWIDEVIQAAKQGGMRVTLYSNFHYGHRLLPVAHVLDEGDAIRISLDAGSAEAYTKVHQPLSIVKDAYRTVRQNIAVLNERREEYGKHFSINIAFLMTKLNFNPYDIDRLVYWGLQHRLNMIRFTVPLVPEIGNDDFPQKEQLTPVQTEFARSFLRELQDKYPGASDLIKIMDDDPELPAKDFKNCHHWKAVAVLGATGRFFPCTSVSLASQRESSGAGNVNDPNFDFWQFWDTMAGKWDGLNAQACASGRNADCTRYEYLMNQQIERLKVEGPDCTGKVR